MCSVERLLLQNDELLLGYMCWWLSDRVGLLLCTLGLLMCAHNGILLHNGALTIYNGALNVYNVALTVRDWTEGGWGTLPPPPMCLPERDQRLLCVV